MKTHDASTHQKHLTVGIQSSLAALALLMAAVAPALAGQGNLGNPGIAPPQSHFRGRTYSEWSAAWFQWVMSMPFTQHPLFDDINPGVDCSDGQTGNVWFIGGHLGGKPAVNRSCTIPAGTALFLNITSNGPVDNTGCDPTGTFVQPTTFSIDQLRTFADGNLDSSIDSRGQCEIDGVGIQNLAGLDPPYRVQSSVFSYTIPAFDNLLVLINCAPNAPCCYDNPPAADLTVAEAVADGVYVMIDPLPVGHHEIRFGNPGGVPLGNVYHITVTGRGH